MKKKLVINGEEILFTIDRFTSREIALSLNGETFHYHCIDDALQDHEMVLRDGNNNHHFTWYNNRGVIDGQDVAVEEISIIKSKSSSSGEDGDEIHSPMPGKILHIHTAKGEAVKEGDVLAVMEAMKMEHSIKSPRAGVVADVLNKAGDRVEGGALLIKLEIQT